MRLSNMSLNRVSVIIPAYNSEEYLAETLSSILEQTHKPFEIIIINDGSTDATNTIIELFSQTDPIIKSITQANKGLSAARNAGKMIASGDFIAFCDADDIWLPQKLENQVRYLNINVEYLAVASKYSTFKSRTDIPKKGKTPSFKISPTNLIAGLAWIPGSASSILIRNTRGISTMYFDEFLSFAEDLDMWVEISKIGKVAIIDSIDVLIRLHEKSMQSNFQTNPNPYLESMFQIVNKVFNGSQYYCRRWVLERLVLWLITKSMLKGNIRTYKQIDWNHSFRNSTTLKLGERNLSFSIFSSLILGSTRACILKISSHIR